MLHKHTARAVPGCIGGQARTDGSSQLGHDCSCGVTQKAAPGVATKVNGCDGSGCAAAVAFEYSEHVPKPRSIEAGMPGINARTDDDLRPEMSFS